MTRNYSATAQATTLTSGVTDLDTTFSVGSTLGFPAAPFVLCVDSGTPSQEVVLVTAVASLALTVTRGYDSTLPTSHSAGATVVHAHSAIDFRDSRTHESATANVHGVSGPLLGATAPVVYRAVAVSGVYPSRPASATYVEWVGSSDPTAQAGLSVATSDTWVQA